ncbi:MAG: DUF4097 family beta strand repeat protein [candidate division Zixibacteria bacterium]|nr:DUF4097 family beta strand repeat protein [candidate division Zixibacteria bacterium]
MIQAALKLKKVLLTFMPMMTIAGLAFAQTAPPPPEDLEERRKSRIVVSAKAQEVAQDYADVLTELEDLTIDYSEVLAELNSKSVRSQRKLLTKLGVRLAKGTYHDDIDLLISDLESTTRDLRKQERELRENDRKAYRVTKSLRRDIEALETVLLYDVDEYLDLEDMLKHEVVIYLREAHLELDEMMAELRTELQVLGDSMALIELGWEISEIPDIPEMPKIPEIPEIPEVIFLSDDPDTVILPTSSETLLVYHYPRQTDNVTSERRQVTTARLYGKGAGTTGAMKELDDSVKVPSIAIPIFVNSPTGDVQITGWDRAMVRAELLVEVSSNSRSRATKLVEQIQLEVSSTQNEIRVDVTVPKITDPGTAIDGSRMEIMVPFENKLNCNGSFGLMNISDIEGGVTLHADNSLIVVDEVSGPVAIAANMGDMSLSDIEADISIQSEFAPIAISDCVGQITIKNTFAAVELSGCTGSTNIRNSGEVRVVDQEGEISITNTGGRIEVRDLEGDVTAVNSHYPIVYDGISGKAEASNQTGSVLALNVVGPLTINSTHAPITVRRAHSTLDLTNKLGHIDVLINNDLEGPSQIFSDHGSIELSISEKVDLRLKANSIHGLISCAWPVDIIESNNAKKIEYSQGNDGPLLTVTGQSGNIKLVRPH